MGDYIIERGSSGRGGDLWGARGYLRGRRRRRRGPRRQALRPSRGWFGGIFGLSGLLGQPFLPIDENLTCGMSENWLGAALPTVSCAPGSIFDVARGGENVLLNNCRIIEITAE